jgi:hypothetical protein
MPAKILWMYWHQGLDAAPELVKICAASWADKNPDYEIHWLDQRSAAEYVSLPEAVTRRRRDLKVQKYSNILRLALLSVYGGVWADATLYCNRALSEWLGEYDASGFFAFRNPEKDRMLASWFITAEPDNTILRRLADRHLAFFTENTFSNQNRPLGRFLLKILSPRWNADYRSTANWLSWFSRKILRVYPYYIFHYTFNGLILTDPECAALWNQVRPFPAEPVLSLKHLEESRDGLSQAQKIIETNRAPIYKLNWRVKGADQYWAGVLELLKRSK